MSKQFQKYLPQRKRSTRRQTNSAYACMQGYIPQNLRNKVSKKMLQEREKGVIVNWNYLCEAFARAYVEE